MSIEKNHKYSELYPRKELSNYIASYFEARNLSNQPHKLTICPDGYFKLIIQLVDNKIVAFFLTGIWAKEVEIVIQPHVVTYGIRFKIIAPELLIKREVKSILNSVEQLDTRYMNIASIEFDSFEGVVVQLEKRLMSKLPAEHEIKSNRLRLSQFLYSTYDDIQAKEVAKQIYWSQREINRYLGKHIGVSLKKYLNIQRCYRAYLQIRVGDFFPESGFFDQAHFIREVKKHTGQTPTALYQKQNDQFIQLKNIKER